MLCLYRSTVRYATLCPFVYHCAPGRRTVPAGHDRRRPAECRVGERAVGV